MAKQMLPVAVRIFTEATVVDGVIMGADGEFWDAWLAPGRSGAWGRRVYQATVYPMYQGAPASTSSVVVVDADRVQVAVVTDPAAAAAATAFFQTWKRTVPVTAFGHRLSVSGLLYAEGASLENDAKPGELLSRTHMVVRDAVIRSTDPTYPFEMAAPFAVLGAVALDTVVRTG